MRDADDTHLLTIGRFAREVGLTPSALRFYDETGLLVPAEVDAGTGYRRYAPDQRDRAVLIRRLRAAGLALPLVSRVIDAPPAEAGRLLARHRAELEAASAATVQAVDDVAASLGSPPAGPTFAVGAGELVAAVGQVVPMAATGEWAVPLERVLLEIDDEVRLVASDGLRLAVRVLARATVQGPPAAALLDTRALTAVATLAPAAGEVGVSVAGGAVGIRGAGFACELPAHDAGAYPDHRSMTAQLPAPVARVAATRADLLDALDEMGGGTVLVRVDGRSATIARPSGGHRFLDAGPGTGGEARAAFAALLLRAAVATAVGPDVIVELAPPPYPATVRSADEGTLTTLVMPVADRR